MLEYPQSRREGREVRIVTQRERIRLTTMVACAG